MARSKMASAVAEARTDAEITRQLERQAKADKKRIQELEKALRYMGQSVQKPCNIPVGHENEIMFGIVSDTHGSSKYAATEQLTKFYEFAYSLGVREMLHAGDIIDGLGNYEGQIFEQTAQGLSLQVDALAETYPRLDGMRTRAILGNHDATYHKKVGADVGRAIMEARPDIEIIGTFSGRVTFTTKSGRRWIVDLAHPDKGTAYALSYNPQRIIESLSGGRKPNMLAVGHFHKAEMMPAYRNIVAVQAGAFQWQTPFMARKHNAAHVGGWIFGITIGSKKDMCNRVRSEFVPFYE